MNGWKAQWYGYVPGFENTNEKLPPLASMALESHEIASPLSLVAVCGAPESLIHTTVAPALMVTLEGWNAKDPAAPVILIVVALAGIAAVAVAAGAGADVEVADGALVEPPVVVAAVAPQPANAIRASATSGKKPRVANRPSCLLVRVMLSPLPFD